MLGLPSLFGGQERLSGPGTSRGRTWLMEEEAGGIYKTQKEKRPTRKRRRSSAAGSAHPGASNAELPRQQGKNPRKGVR